MRQYLRDIFEQEENKIVSASYEDGKNGSFGGKEPQVNVTNNAATAIT